MRSFLAPNIIAAAAAATAVAHRFPAASHFKEGLDAVADFVIAAHRLCSLGSQQMLKIA